MALDNTVKIGDIITALQSMQGINQKADLKSALVAKGVSALDTDNVADLISKLNSANLILDGKKWASGTGATTYRFTINNLDFKPSIIIMTQNNEMNGTYLAVYCGYISTTGYLSNGSSFRSVDGTINYVVDGGFSLQTTNVVNKWWAIE